MKKKISLMLAIVLLLSPISCMAEFAGFLESYKGLLKGLGRLGAAYSGGFSVGIWRRERVECSQMGNAEP